MKTKVEISHRTIIFTVLFLLSLAFLYVVRDIILALFIAFLIASILNPLVTRLHRRRIPRGLSVLLAYLVVVALFSLSIAALVPTVVDETTKFINHLPDYITGFSSPFAITDQILEQLATQLSMIPVQAAKITVSLFSNILAVVSVFVLAYYLLTDRETLNERLVEYLGESKAKNISLMLIEIEQRLGGWARAQITLMVVVGLANYIGLLILGIPFVLPLSIFAGLLEIVPYAGPTLGAVPAIIIGFGISPLMGVGAAAVAFIVQQLENYVFVPQIMKKSTGVNPLVTLVALAIGFRLAGVIGLLISIPVLLTVQVFAGEYLKTKLKG